MSTKPEIRIEIGTLAFEGLGRSFSQRAAASFEQAFARELRDCPADTRWNDQPGPITMPAPGRQTPEVFGRRLASQVARALQQ